MTDARALAIEIRHAERGDLLCQALLVPSERYAAVGARIAPVPERVASEGRLEERQLTADAWSEIDAWAAAGDAGLPARPAPLPDGVVAQLFSGVGPVVGWRVASIPIGRRDGVITSSAPR